MDAERVLEGQTVIVENGRIAGLGDARRVSIPAGAQTIDGLGLPGTTAGQLLHYRWVVLRT